ncbi:MAG: enoyl-CoA hydratase [Marmoricola sp.]|nr:enoyl-CoA hydratase [Marmoricola sp.]
MLDGYSRFEFELDDDKVLHVTMAGATAINAVDEVMHTELSRLWFDIDAQPDVRAVVLSGRGDNFSGGGDLDFIVDMTQSQEMRVRVMREARQIVVGLLELRVPLVSALHGSCVGAGLISGLLADVSVAGDDAMLMDAHTRVGLVAGDHSVVVWPLLCGMAKAKYRLLVNDPLSGREASEIGLVSLSVPDDEVRDRAAAIARKLALGAPSAIQWTKQALNMWLRQSMPAFEAGLALEFVGLAGPEPREGAAALLEKRRPDFSGMDMPR